MAGRPHGSCARQILFADTLDSEHSQANREHRVVTLTIPVAEAARPRRVQVAGNRDAQTSEPQTAGGTQAIPARPPAGQAAPTGTS